MLLPFGAFGHPLAQRLDLGGGEFQAGIDGRHALGLVLRSDSPDHLAGGGIPFDDGAPPTQVRLGSRFTIEAQRNFFGGGVGCMAVVALVGKDGPDVAVEFDRAVECRGEQRQCEGEGAHWRSVVHPIVPPVGGGFHGELGLVLNSYSGL